MSPSSSSDIAGYRILSRLGQGGMARVFVACSEKQPGFTKLLVLKILKEDIAGDAELLQMFEQEAHIAARLNHANVVQTYEVGRAGELPFIAMEYLEGQALSTVRRRLGDKFPLALHLRALAETLCGLHYAHELADFDGRPMELVHRDVSPQNVFLTYDGTVKVLDFGIAKISTVPSLTRTGVLKGKVGYMAPEQISNAKVDRRADVFAVGVMLWEALAGRRLVDSGANEVSVLRARLAGEVPPLREAAPDAPEDLVAIAEKALALDPDNRYATAEEMQNALEDHLRASSNPQGRDLGKLLREAFAADRTKLKRTIEEQLASGPSTVSAKFPSTVHAVELPVEATVLLPTEAKRRRRAFAIGGVAVAALAVAFAVASRSPKAASPSEEATPATVAMSARPSTEAVPAASATAPPPQASATSAVAPDHDTHVEPAATPAKPAARRPAAATAPTAKPAATAPARADDFVTDAPKRAARPIDTSSPF